MKYLITGLGNVGNEYAHTRHNIGFDVVSAFLQKHESNFHTGRLAFVSEVKWKRKTFICICPTTFMNLSGKAVKYWMDKEKIPVERILVIVDDVAIPLNRLRLRAGGNHGGHNGLNSIQEALGTAEYPRLRFGIGNAYQKGQQSDFVLGKWLQEEEPMVKLKIARAVEIIEIFALRGISEAMNLVNNQEFSL